MLLFVGIVLGGTLVKLTPALAVAFPNHEATVGDVARDVLALNHARLADEAGGWNKKDVWEALCRAIALHASVAREKITPEARIVHDLCIE